MLHVVTNVLKAWDKVTVATINHAWRRLAPHLTTARESDAQSTQQARDAALHACRAVPGCSEVTAEEIDEIVHEETTPEEARARVEAMDDEVGTSSYEPSPQQEEEPRQPKEISVRQINNILAASEQFKEAVKNNEVDGLRSAEMISSILQLVHPYEDLRTEKVNHFHQGTLDSYFRRNQEEAAEAEDDAMSVVSDFNFDGFAEEAERIIEDNINGDSTSEDEDEEAAPEDEGAGAQ